MSLNYDEILPGLWVGSCLDTFEEVLEIRQAGATAVLSLQTDEDLDYRGLRWDEVEKWCQDAGLTAVREPVRDFDPDHLSERLPDCARALDALVSSGHRVYLHCTAGINRSPSVAIVWLVWRRGKTLQEAYNLVTRRRYCEPRLETLQTALRAQPAL